LDAIVVSDEFAKLTTIVVLKDAPRQRVAQLRNKVNVIEAPARKGRVDLKWLLARLGGESVTSLLVEGGGEVNAAFLEGRLAQRVAFFYAPKILGGSDSRTAVAGAGAKSLEGALELADVQWQQLGPDLMLTARVTGG
jgi:diaminohydroxyphosphoribosylaminopyrimidine deaminase/5-amino-6-(5-phosphoribosylamino)uracil reductase